MKEREMHSNTIYYVYQWLREDGTPYYVGKGKDGRAWRKGSPPKSRVVIVEDNLSERHALALEVELIAKHGRKDLGTGILRNLTNGGEGVSGLIQTEEDRRKKSESMLRTLDHTRPHTFEFEGKAFVNRRDAAAHYGVNVATISRWKTQGRRSVSNEQLKTVVIDGLHFNSHRDAAKHFDVSCGTITYWKKTGRATQGILQGKLCSL